MMVLTHEEVAELRETKVCLLAMAEMAKNLKADLYACSDEHDMFEVLKRLCTITAITAKVAGEAIGKLSEAL